MRSWKPRKAKMNYDNYVENHHVKKYIKCCGSDFFFQILVVIILMLFAGLMNGLTLGYMSMNLVDLEVLVKSGASKSRLYASMFISTPLVSATEIHFVDDILLL